MRTMHANSARYQEEDGRLAKVSFVSKRINQTVQFSSVQFNSVLGDGMVQFVCLIIPLFYLIKPLSPSLSFLSIIYYSRRNRASGGRAYWIRHLREMGIYEDGTVLRARDREDKKNPHDAKPTTDSSNTSSDANHYDGRNLPTA